jgi:four helix bundle protein
MGTKVEYPFRKLEVWQLGMELVNEIYRVTGTFPPEEKFSLISQVRRAAISVPLNIAEGSIKRTRKDFGSYVRTALGSLMETMTCLEIALNRGYINKTEYGKLDSQVQALYFAHRSR